jgi:hypothetical protein
MSFGVVESCGLMDWLWSLEMFGEDWKDFSGWRQHAAISSLHCLKNLSDHVKNSSWETLTDMVGFVHSHNVALISSCYGLNFSSTN